MRTFLACVLSKILMLIVHHPQIPTDATTEQRMIAGSVFSALNEAWDKFKADNGL